ncbi:MAG: Fic family protein [Saprospiraceae bacterium]|nr:Fic family protein [Saprospiraceae bacterium]
MTVDKEILTLIEAYKKLDLSAVIDYSKFNLYAITHHSTNIEGSTLTEVETNLLLDEDLTPSGKPLVHTLMTKDHYQALLYVIEKAKERSIVDEALVKNINALVLKQTGTVYKTVLGDIDSAKGEYRLNNVRAGNRYFVSYDKVPSLTRSFCQLLQSNLAKVERVEEQLLLSFDAHFDLVSIHPFYDGNGRTALLLMNFVQAYFDLPLAIVFKEDKIAYFEALEKSREVENLAPFRRFMIEQYAKYLNTEIDNFNRSIQNNFSIGKGFSLFF